MSKIVLIAVMTSIKKLLEHGYKDDAIEVIEKILREARKYSKRTKQLRFELAQTRNYSASDDIQNEFI